MGLAAISVLRSVARELYSISGYQECRKALYILAFAVSVLVATLIIVQETDSTALSAYSSLTIFDILFLLSALLSAWAARQETTLAYSYGYSRFEVLAVFTCTMLAQLNSFFIVKESVEHMFENDEDGHEHAHTASHTSGSTKHSSEKRQPLAVTVGAVLVAVCHYACVYLVRHPAFDHVTRWCSSSWIQEQVAEISHSICRVLPFLSVFLLPRLNPLSLIASVGLLMLMLTKLMVEVYNYHFADTGAAITFAALLIYTWLPMTKFTGRILLQSTPPHLLTQRDKIMNEIGTLDGVLEVKDDKLWTCGFSSLVVTVKVRVRRDANEQMVLAHIHDKLSILASEVTVQLVKDIDWSNAPRQFHWQHDAHMDHDDHSGHGHSHSHGGHGGHDHSHDHGGHGHDHDHALPQPRYNGGGGGEDFVVIDFDRNYGTPSTAAAPEQHSHSHEHSHEGAMHNHSHDHGSVAQPPSTNTYNFSAGDNFYAGAAVAPFQKPPSSGFPMPTTYSTNLPPIDRSLVPPSAAASLTPNSRRYGVELSAGGDGVVSNRANAAASGGSLLPSVSASSSNAANFAPPPPYYGKKD